jgi:hypothetical protein
MSDFVVTMVAIVYALVCLAKEYDRAEAPPENSAAGKSE